MSVDVNAEEQIVEEERYEPLPRLTVADGFRFGCGLILAGVAFGFVLIILATTAFLLALALGFPLPFGIP